MQRILLAIALFQSCSCFEPKSVYDKTWLDGLTETEASKYTGYADAVHNFLLSDEDSNPTDQYIGSFHSAGTFSCKHLNGGSNGGTIHNPAELEDEQNGCISTAIAALHRIIANAPIPHADAVVIAGVVALDFMHFPRMDLVRVEGGRKNWKDVAYRGRLPSADDDPLELFRDQYGLTSAELVALIGGGHEVGAAHAKCSGYVGAWTSDPLTWTNEFFPDLMQDDWTWYEVCSYENGTTEYMKMESPFAEGGESGEGSSHGNHHHKRRLGGDDEEEEADVCAVAQSLEPLICEGQAMRGCAFEEGVYPSDTVPCPGVEIRLTSDFWLRENEELAPHARAYAASPDLLNEVFGKAYHKITHAGLDRCGMTGGACASGTTCVQTKDEFGAVLTEQCEPDGSSLPQGAAGGATKKKTTRRRNDPGLIVAAAVSSVATLVLAGLVAFYACRRPAGRDLEGPVEIKTPPHEETKHSA